MNIVKQTRLSVAGVLVLILAPVLLLSAGCSVFQPAPVKKIRTLPVVRVGNPAPLNRDYVVFYPAGHAFTVRFKTTGSLFGKNKIVRSRIKLKKDLYLYKRWASHDGKHWKHSHDLLKVKTSGGFDIRGLQATVRLDTKTGRHSRSREQDPERRKQSAWGKYSGLLRVLKCPRDTRSYGSFYDYGFWEGKVWCGQNAPGGYWVWVKPNWYIWQHRK